MPQLGMKISHLLHYGCSSLSSILLHRLNKHSMCHRAGSEHPHKSVLTRQKSRDFQHPIPHTMHEKIQRQRQRGGRYLETWYIWANLRLWKLWCLTVAALLHVLQTPNFVKLFPVNVFFFFSTSALEIPNAWYKSLYSALSSSKEDQVLPASF